MDRDIAIERRYELSACVSRGAFGEVLRAVDRATGRVFAGPGGSVRAVRASGPLKANNGEALLAAAIAGRGIVYLPTFMVGATIAAGKLVPLFSGDWQPEELAISAVYPPTRHLSAKVRRFVDFLTRRFADPPWDRWERTGKAKAARPR